MTRFIAVDDVGVEIDVTEPVKVAYDAIIGSMDYGSGFLDSAEMIALARLGEILGDPEADSRWLSAWREHHDAVERCNRAAHANRQAALPRTQRTPYQRASLPGGPSGDELEQFKAQVLGGSLPPLPEVPLRDEEAIRTRIAAEQAERGLDPRHAIEVADVIDRSGLARGGMAVTGAPLSFSIDIEAAPDVIFDVFWEFGDGGEAHGRDASHVYRQAGTYSPRVTVTTSDGAARTLIFEPILVAGAAE